jgi:superfamily I DNA/RNA helicase
VDVFALRDRVVGDYAEYVRSFLTIRDPGTRRFVDTYDGVVPLEKSVVKVITLQSAKGLEFPVVAVAGFIDGLPPAGGRGAGEEETEEALARQRRLLFVAMTRAMRSLLVVVPDRPSPLLTGFDPQLWNAQAPLPGRAR